MYPTFMVYNQLCSFGINSSWCLLLLTAKILCLNSQDGGSSGGAGQNSLLIQSLGLFSWNEANVALLCASEALLLQKSSPVIGPCCFPHWQIECALTTAGGLPRTAGPLLQLALVPSTLYLSLLLNWGRSEYYVCSHAHTHTCTHSLSTARLMQAPALTSFTALPFYK